MAWKFGNLAAVVVVLVLTAPGSATAQINFEKHGYYLSLGDSPAAGEGALPATHGFVYRLYDRGVFGPTQTMDFGNIAIKDATADEVQLFQVPQALLYPAAAYLALEAFRASLAGRVAQINADIATAGKTARVGYVDTFAAMEGRSGLLLIDRRNGFVGGFDFEIHPTNAGHTAMAREFERTWKRMP